MDRRTLLGGLGVVVPAALGGCLSARDRSGDGTTDDGDGTTDDGDGTTDESDGGGTDGGSDGGDGDSADDPDARPVLTGYEVSRRAVPPDVDGGSGGDPWGLYLASRDAAGRYPDLDASEAVRSFVEETAFEDGDRLLSVTAYGPQTCYRLVLDGPPKVTASGLATVATRLERTAPEGQPCGDAIVPATLFVRLSFNPGAVVPEAVAVETVDRGRRVEFRVEAER